MATSKSVRRALLIVGLLCLVGALLPYYSKTGRPVAGVPDASFDLPILGNQRLPKEATDTLLRIGLPFSPLFTYETHFDYPQAPKFTTIKPEDGKVTVGSASISTQGPGTAEMTVFNFNYSFNSHFNITAWSSALGLLGLVLLIVGLRGPGRKPESADLPMDVGQA
jgi:hypothetical protein